MATPTLTPGPHRDSQETVSVVLSTEVVQALEAVGDRAAFVDKALRRALRLSGVYGKSHRRSLVGALPGRSVGRPIKHTVADLQDCLGSRVLTSGELQRRAAETLDISRATFYRLLERGRREWLFRQRMTDGKWLSISQKVAEAPDDLPDEYFERADAPSSAEVP
jgi:hypothetical protein